MSRPANVEQFLQKYGKLAVKYSKQSGLPASLILAQAALETGWGRRAPNNNFFGIKARPGDPGSVRLPTMEYRGGVPKMEQHSFTTYASPEASFAGYVRFMKENQRYKNVFGKDPYKAAEEVAKAGYATSPSYASMLKNMMKSYDLTEYDKYADYKEVPGGKDISYGDIYEHQGVGAVIGEWFAGLFGNRTKYPTIEPEDPSKPKEEYGDLSIVGKFTRIGFILVIIILMFIALVQVFPANGLLKGVRR